MASGCPFTPQIYAAAFASATWSGVNKPGPTMYSSGVPGAVAADFYPYFGAITVANEHLNFPPYQNTYSASTQNAMAISQHSYGKTGYALRALGQGAVAGIAANRTQPFPAAYPTLPYVLTEVAAHTTGTFDGLATTYDTNFEASRLGGQLIGQALDGWDTYVFKVRARPNRTPTDPLSSPPRRRSLLPAAPDDRRPRPSPPLLRSSPPLRTARAAATTPTACPTPRCRPRPPCAASRRRACCGARSTTRPTRSATRHAPAPHPPPLR